MIDGKVLEEEKGHKAYNRVSREFLWKAEGNREKGNRIVYIQVIKDIYYGLKTSV